MTLEAIAAIIGRTHPAILHLPIGLTIGLVASEWWQIWRNRRGNTTPPKGSVLPVLLWLTVASSIVTTATGLLLAREEMHATGAVNLHRNLGLVFTATLALVALFHAFGQRRSYLVTLMLGAILIGPVGHLGGNLTHGEGYLLAPLNALQPVPETSVVVARDHERPTFESHILPLLTERCSVCHGPGARKGGLRLDSFEAVNGRGASGPALVAGRPDDSELLRRLRLPDNDEQRMPPTPRTALSAHEVALLEAWIAGGAAAEASFAIDSNTQDALRNEDPESAATGTSDPVRVDALPGVPPAPEQAVTRLREAFAHVAPIAPGQPNLWVDLTPLGPQLDDARFLALITDVGPSLAELRAARTGISDDALQALQQASGLTVLDLSWSNITDAGLQSLPPLPHLRVLRLVGTQVSDAGLAALAKMPDLQTVYLWRTDVSSEALTALEKARPDIQVIRNAAGAAALEVEAALHFTSDRPSPDAATPSAKLANETCPVSGRPVDARYRVLHQNKVIGFCCPECPKTFWEYPQQYQKTSGE